MGRTIRSAVLHLKKAGDEPLERVTVSSVGAEWFEGTGSGYAIQPGGATFRHRRHPDLPWSIGRRRPLPRHPGQRRHDLADGRRLAARSRRLAAHAGRPAGRGGPRWPESATASSSSTTPARSGRERARRFTFRLFPNRFVYSRDQNRRERSLLHDRARAGRPPAARRPERPARRARHRTPAGRRGPRLVGHARRRRPGRHARVLRARSTAAHCRAS